MRSVKILCVFSAALLALSACGTTPTSPESSTPPPAASSTSTTTTSTTAVETTTTTTTITAATSTTVNFITDGIGAVSEEYAPPPDKRKLKLRVLDEEVVLTYEGVYESFLGSKFYKFWRYAGKAAAGNTVKCYVATETEQILRITNGLSYYEDGVFVQQEQAQAALAAELQRMGLPTDDLPKINIMSSRQEVRSNFGVVTVSVKNENEEKTGEKIEFYLYAHNGQTYITSIYMSAAITRETTIPYFIPQWV